MISESIHGSNSQEEEMYQKKTPSQKFDSLWGPTELPILLKNWRGNFSFYSVSGFQQKLRGTVEKIGPSGDGIILRQNLGMEETWKYLL